MLNWLSGTFFDLSVKVEHTHSAFTLVYWGCSTGRDNIETISLSWGSPKDFLFIHNWIDIVNEKLNSGKEVQTKGTV